MALHPSPLDLVSGCQLIKRLPQIRILDRLLVGGLPAVALPAMNPFADALLHIRRVGKNNGITRPRKYTERFDHGRHFHAIVCRVGNAAEQLFLGFTKPENGTPATDARIAFASSVRINFNHVYFTTRRCADWGAERVTSGNCKVVCDCLYRAAVANLRSFIFLSLHAGAISLIPFTRLIASSM